jgi:integrase
VHLDAAMSKAKKRTRTTAKDTAPVGLTIREHHEVKSGKGYSSFMVQGWKEDGKWKRKKFKLRKDAERFVALKQVELENQGRSQRMVLSPLTDEQIQQAVDAFDALGSTYSLKEAVQFFLENHRPPEFTISLSEGIKLYLDDRERDGVRHRTIKQAESVLKMFISAVNDCEVHKVTPQKVEGFLRSLRAKDRVSPAKRKTWNNYRNDLSHFFGWCNTADLGTQRPWTFTNPVESIRVFSAKQVAEQRDEIVTTDPADVQRMFTVLMRWRGGVMVKPFALAYFAGIRPDGELNRLSLRADELINLKTGFITIPASVSKTKEARQVKITENLAAWLKAYADFPVIPKNWDRLVKQVRAHFKLSHDEARHSFISYHVALHRSVGDAALQAGNSESIVKKHYLNLHPSEEGQKFFNLTPVGGKAIFLESDQDETPTHLKAV